MSFHCILIVPCLVAALTANTLLAEPVEPKDGPLGMKFVKLPKGTFYMGWDGKKRGVKTEIKEDFEIAVYTVTQELWLAVMGDNPSRFSRTGSSKEEVKNISDADLKQFPIEQVSWNHTQHFIKKLNEKENGNGYLYRLPMSAEWEYACRGGATSEDECSFHFYFAKPTNDLSSDQANFWGEDPFGNAPKGPFLIRTTKVGSYKPNKLGLYDMHGNVFQWCQDLTREGGPDRVFRGSCWASRGSECKASSLAGAGPLTVTGSHGFRLVRVQSGGK